MDCHIETHIEAGTLKHRASVVHTETRRVLYVTWPYASEQAAMARARRWMALEYARSQEPGLFAEEGNRQQATGRNDKC